MESAMIGLDFVEVCASQEVFNTFRTTVDDPKMIFERQNVKGRTTAIGITIPILKSAIEVVKVIEIGSSTKRHCQTDQHTSPPSDERFSEHSRFRGRRSVSGRPCIN
jgi:hypothetical protein